MKRYEAIVMGVSAGGMNAMRNIFCALPAGFALPFVVVQHIGARSDGKWIEILDSQSEIHIKEADEKEKIKPGTAYIAPPNYHLLIEKDRTLSLTVDERVNFSRPSIDVLFESAAIAYSASLIGITLTGSNNDGANGLLKVKENGGLVIVQDPQTAESPAMPEAALAAVKPDYVLSLGEIVALLIRIDKHNQLKKL
ncbi:MAG TPA: chemotaxis protein CheB [Flavobacteriales bacterium]|nr:chemotaxis protein CheB [Flavobacteriales bacterium]